MSNFNINNPPGGPYIPFNIIGWLVVGLQTLWRRVNGVSSSGGGSATNNLVPLFDHYTSVGNVGTTETDLYSDTIAGGTLAADGDKLQIVYGGSIVGADSIRLAKVYFGGTVCFNTGDLTEPANKDWRLELSLIRVSSSVIRCSGSFISTNSVSTLITDYTELTSLDLSTGNILKITGQATGGPPAPADNEIVATMGTVTWISHA